ncbi:hypothetical protein EYF80_049088 [Liparis tanakae]|uniref:Uncharacterized protein n=1 Tax=Liparis tanakae TaxID=230148 RepID=A0A4Z2FIG9_9TELE|nr:hypothetical protein EYF80_049088 [Liparis tanakae]
MLPELSRGLPSLPDALRALARSVVSSLCSPSSREVSCLFLMLPELSRGLRSLPDALRALARSGVSCLCSPSSREVSCLFLMLPVLSRGLISFELNTTACGPRDVMRRVFAGVIDVTFTAALQLLQLLLHNTATQQPILQPLHAYTAT